MIIQNLDDLRKEKLPKRKFIGKYIELLNKVDKENSFRFKSPQVIGEGKNSNNNWLDYILSMNEEEYENFKKSLNS